MRKRLTAHMPSLRVPLSPNLHVFTNQEAPQSFRGFMEASFGGFMEAFGGFMEASLHKHH